LCPPECFVSPKTLLVAIGRFIEVEVKNMEIKKIEPKPYEKSVFPGISFDIEISYTKYKEAIVSINGWLETDDGKIVAEIREEVMEQVRYSEIGARDSAFDKKFKEDVYKTTLIALLDRKALDHIENRRMENEKGDVNLTLSLNLKTVSSMAAISHVHTINPKDVGLTPVEIYGASGQKIPDWRMLVYAYSPSEYSSYGNIWILSGDGRPIFLATSEQPLKGSLRIPSMDWIHDYAPKFGLGEYFVVEIPKGKKIIAEAWSYVEKAEECFRRWDIGGVCDNCRKAGDVLNKKIETEFGKDSFTYNERWGRAYLRFFNYLVSLGLHLEDMEGKSWEELIKSLPEGFPHPKRRADYPHDELKRFGKADAEHILTITKLLIKYAEELLEER